MHIVILITENISLFSPLRCPERNFPPALHKCFLPQVTSLCFKKFYKLSQMSKGKKEKKEGKGHPKKQEIRVVEVPGLPFLPLPSAWHPPPSSHSSQPAGQSQATPLNQRRKPPLLGFSNSALQFNCQLDEDENNTTQEFKLITSLLTPDSGK